MANLESRLKPSAHLVFRTTNVGHHACENASRPLKSRAEAWRQLTRPGADPWEWRPNVKAKDLFVDKYNWRGPPLFESAWGEAARSAFGSRFAYLNVSFLDARADGHVATAMRYGASTTKLDKWKARFPLDCLHYCYPGPADYWALSLYNMLMNNERYRGGAG